MCRSVFGCANTRPKKQSKTTMRILITGAGGNVGKGMTQRLRAAGHDLVLYDVNRLPDEAPFDGLPFIQGDAQEGIGLDRAAQGCDLILHTPAWHGVHWRAKTEADFWRLNVNGTFWMFQAAVAAGIKSVVFLSSQAWHGHFDKYGFTKVIGEEICEYNRRNHGIGYVAIRPADFTPYGSFTGYGTRLLRGGVDREDVLDLIELSIAKLAPQAKTNEAAGLIANAVRPNAFTAEQIADWESDPLSACEQVFPNSRELVEKYQLDIKNKPGLSDLGEAPNQLGYAPKHHFGTFLDELRRLDAEKGQDTVRAMRCSY